MSADPASLQIENEELLEFFYLCPVALLQLNRHGAVQMISAEGARLLMQITRDATIDNFFTVFQAVAPELRARAAAYPEDRGLICESVRIEAGHPPGAKLPLVVEVTLRKLGPDQLMAVVMDVSRLAQEEQVREAIRARLEEAIRVKSEFLAAMSHEFRTPMAGIIGMTDLLLGTPLLPEQREYAETVASSAEALLTLINDILDFSKMDVHKLKLDPQPMDLKQVVEDAVRLQIRRAADKGLGLEVRYPAEVPRHVVADPHRLRQILLNYLGNAIKFTDQGHVVIAVRCLALEPDRAARAAAPDRARLRLEVQDTGIGIPQDQIGRLFQMFSQVDSSSTRRHGGTGIGLAICRHLAELMDGRVDVASQPGVGSTFGFEVTLPLAAAPAQAAQARGEAPARVPAPAPRCLRVLVAEDNPVNQRIAQGMLKKCGCQVDLAENGRRALEMALARPYDILFMDCQMPEMDGFQATAEIRAREDPGRRVPIVALTANAMQGDREHCLGVGMDDYLSKPIKFADMEVVLRRWAPAAQAAPGTQAAPG